MAAEGSSSKRGSFRIPAALDAAGQLVFAGEGVRGDEYTCPGCSARVAYRAGEQRRHHFAHRPDPSGQCGPETVKHRLAKLTVERSIMRWLDGSGPRPVFIRHCPGLRSTHGCGRRVEHPLGKITGVAVEREFDGLRPDLLLLRGDEPVAAIEIFATHRVDRAKGDRLKLPWVELHADDVAALVHRWLPMQDNFRPLFCDRCIADASDYRQRYAEGYLRGCARCHACHEDIQTYAWLGSDWSDAAPPEPRPRTVQLRYSRTLGARYWANTCPHCRALQGDFFLYHHPDGPFFGLAHVVDPQQLFNHLPEGGWDDWSRKEFVAAARKLERKVEADARQHPDV